MTVRELIEFLSHQNPDALVVEQPPVDGGPFAELTATGEMILAGVKNGPHSRLYLKDRGRIPCVVLAIDNNIR